MRGWALLALVSGRLLLSDGNGCRGCPLVSPRKYTDATPGTLNDKH